MSDVAHWARDLITRTDQTIPPLTDNHWAALLGDASNRALIAHVGFACRDAAAVRQAIAVHEAFRDAHGREAADTEPDEISLFVMAAPSLEAQHLRRNSLAACELAKLAAGRPNAVDAILALILPFPPALSGSVSRAPNTRGEPAEAQIVIATSDEIALMRLAAPYAHSRWFGRPPAALAVPTAGGAPTEGAQVRWSSYVRDDSNAIVAVGFVGVHVDQPGQQRFQAPRANDLDAWERAAITAWEAEAASPGFTPPRSVLYTGTRPLNSDTAMKCYVKAIVGCREAAGLAHAPGTTPGGISMWSAAHDVAFRGLQTAATRHGTTPARLLTKLDRCRRAV